MTLPFTPFHMGAALIVKPGLDRNFSVITFGIAQVAMDIEPGVGMLTGANVLHGPTHTILGALIIACLVMLVAPGVCSYLLSRWNKEVTHYGLPRLVQAETVPKRAVMIGAFFGTLSHVALDSLIHHDIEPLLPFSRSNPLTGLVTHDQVYELCVMAGVLGAAAWLALKWAGRAREIDGVPAPLPITAPRGMWVVWMKELRFTWFWTLLIAVGPALLYGSGFFSMGVLMAAVLIGVPALAMSCLLAKGFTMKGLRRLAIMVLVPMLTMYYVSQVDEQIPANATPITEAIESFRLETGHYPDSLEMLMPKHLKGIPDLRFSLIQPQVNYRVRDGKPHFTVPSASGDAFAQYEYDFESKVWKHHS